MSKLAVIRRENLLALIEHSPNKSAFCKKCGLSNSQLSQLISPKDYNVMGSKVARRIEAAHDLAAGWMDRQRSGDLMQVSDKELNIILKSFIAVSKKLEDKSIKLSSLDSDVLEQMLTTSAKNSLYEGSFADLEGQFPLLTTNNLAH